ncbi:hypothetical protein [Nocardia sp. NPDC052112]|uniref:hypothetical protein n=1 Tax=Nocardia sp. NPDC052112 TaxID=3155646 RepID=UPI003446F223
MTAQRRAVVAGGGIGELAAAIGLRRAGWSVRVLERRVDPGEIGAGWSFAPNALRADDRQRRPRSQQVQRMARQDPRISLSTSGLAYALLTGLTRLAGGGVAARKAARPWDRTPPTVGVAASRH